MIIADLFFAFVASLTALAYPMLVRVITAQATALPRDEGIQLIFKVLAAFIGLMVIEYVSNFFINYYGHVTGAKIEYDMRKEIFTHLQRLPFSFYDERKTGQLMSRITHDLNDMTELSHHGPEDLVISFVRILGSFIVLININWLLTLVIFAFLPAVGLFAFKSNRKMNAAFKKNRESVADINMRIEDSLSGIRVVKSFANEGLEIDKFNEGNEGFVKSKRRAYRVMAGFHGGIGLLLAIVNAVVAVGGGLLILNNILKMSDLITFLLYINLLISPIQQLIRFTEQYQNGMTGFTRFLEIMDITPDIDDVEGAAELTNVSGSIEFKNVGFRYSFESDYVLKNLSLKAKKGSYIALVGSSGVGKTTLCNLIPRFYDVTEGSVEIDGTDVRSVTQESLRQNIGSVQQDVYLFAGTVYENISYGKANPTREEVVEAAKNANAHEFIMKLPEGYDTYIGQRGIKLSGGQKQRISIARVFLKNPPILIFDEATSSLDNESEQIVQDSFERLAKNRTTFVIAHRLSTIKNAERILVLTENGIAEDGTHSELMAKDGIYRKLYNMQFAEERIRI